jgi:hypothetical protein
MVFAATSVAFLVSSARSAGSSQAAYVNAPSRNARTNELKYAPWWLPGCSWKKNETLWGCSIYA